MNTHAVSPDARTRVARASAHVPGDVRDSDADATELSPQVVSRPYDATRKRGPLKFYLVEDNVIIRENLAETLHEMVGAEVVGTADAQSEATLWLCDSSHEWDVAVIDIFLKRGNGIQVVAALQHHKHQHQVIVLSNYASSEVRNECIRLGADAVFDKSTELDDLLEFCTNVKLH